MILFQWKTAILNSNLRVKYFAYPLRFHTYPRLATAASHYKIVLADPPTILMGQFWTLKYNTFIGVIYFICFVPQLTTSYGQMLSRSELFLNNHSTKSVHIGSKLKKSLVSLF